MPAYDPTLEDVYTIKEDAPDPLGQVRGGYSSTVGLNKNCLGNPQVRYKDMILTMDVYKMDDEVMVHTYCPRCRNALRISSARKQIDFSNGKLSIEPFKCTWELDPEGRRMEFGLGLCNWQVGIKDNVARDA